MKRKFLISVHACNMFEYQLVISPDYSSKLRSALFDENVALLFNYWLSRALMASCSYPNYMFNSFWKNEVSASCQPIWTNCSYSIQVKQFNISIVDMQISRTERLWIADVCRCNFRAAQLEDGFQVGQSSKVCQTNTNYACQSTN